MKFCRRLSNYIALHFVMRYRGNRSQLLHVKDIQKPCQTEQKLTCMCKCIQHLNNTFKKNVHSAAVTSSSYCNLTQKRPCVSKISININNLQSIFTVCHKFTSYFVKCINYYFIEHLNRFYINDSMLLNLSILYKNEAICRTAYSFVSLTSK